MLKMVETFVFLLNLYFVGFGPSVSETRLDRGLYFKLFRHLS